MSVEINLDQLRLKPAELRPAGKSRVPRHRSGEQFLKGPVPWAWLCVAGRLGGKSLHIALVLWHLASMTKSARFPLSRRTGDDLGVRRHAAYRALSKLERAGL